MILALMATLLAGGGGYLWWQSQQTAAAQATTGNTMRTSVARRGNLEMITTAAGTIIAASERTLGFETSAELLELYVAVGDIVSAGDPLARIDDLKLRQAVSSAEMQALKAQLALAEAQEALADLQAEADALALLEAQAALQSAEARLADLRASPSAAEIAAAEATLAKAQEAYARLQEGPTADELQQAQWDLERSKNSLWSAQMSRDARANDPNSYDQAQVSVLNAEIAVAQAEVSLRQLQEPASAAELAQARATVLEAQEKLATLRQGATAAERAEAELAVAKAQDNLAELQDGPAESDLARAEANVRQAELDLAQAEMALESARRDLAQATLAAPFGGTIMAIQAQVGESVGANLLTLADLSLPVLEVFVDETELDMLQVGFEAQVELDSLPGQTFAGRVTQVDPGLATSGGMRVVRGLVALDADALNKPMTLPTGMSATVDIIGGRATNAVLAPVEALREIEPGQYAVFVVENGEPRLRMVEVGLMDITYAEIISGLEAGEVLSTGLVEVR
jgi:RND family efflux transporter MFP subunit